MRRRQRIYDTRTPARMAWLTLLSQSPQIRSKSNAGRGCVGFECMRLGWTQWAKRELIDLHAKEELTAEGRRVLTEYLEDQRRKEEEYAQTEME